MGINNIIDKINLIQESTKLAKHEVELGAFDDLKKISNVIKDGFPIMDKLRITSAQLADEYSKVALEAATKIVALTNKKKALMDLYKSANDKYEGMGLRAVEMGNKFKAAVKELGLGNFESKEADDIDAVFNSKQFVAIMNINNSDYFFRKLNEDLNSSKQVLIDKLNK